MRSATIVPNPTWPTGGENSLKNEGDGGSDGEKAVLKVETVDVIVNR
jgi:hypothetical protein